MRDPLITTWVSTCRARLVRHERLLRFLAVGVVNTLFGYAVFAILFTAFGDHNLAVIGATLLGVLFNFVTTGRLVFGNRSWRALPGFVLAYGFALGFNLVVLNLLVAAGVSPLAAQALSLPVVIVTAYLINARIVFRTKT